MAEKGSGKPGDRKGRRGFLLTLGGIGVVWVGAALWPVFRYLSPQTPPNPFGDEGRAICKGVEPADVMKAGQGKNGSYAGRGVLVFRARDGDLRAFDSKCTHAGCNVEFQGDRIFCHCHGGTYDLEGTNIAGPPPRPLTPLRVVEESGVLYVSPLDA